MRPCLSLMECRSALGGTSTGSGSSYSNGDAPIDFGNDISQLNPEDIASGNGIKRGLLPLPSMVREQRMALS
jgi:hypothetical protein